MNVLKSKQTVYCGCITIPQLLTPLKRGKWAHHNHR